MATAQSDIQNKIRKGKLTSEKENLEDYLEIADEKVSAEQIKLSNEEDLNSLLRLAEDLKEKIEKPKTSTLRLRFTQIISVLFLSYISISLLKPNVFPFPDSFILKNIVLITYIIILAISQFMIHLIRNRLLPDKLALKEVLQLLREVHGTIAEREDWSILKRAEFRIRLSRFDLSEKKDSVFNFFS